MARSRLNQSNPMSHVHYQEIQNIEQYRKKTKTILDQKCCRIFAGGLVNRIWYAIGTKLLVSSIPKSFWSAGQTKEYDNFSLLEGYEG